MKVLVACEFSGIVRDAFTRRGHDAWSCDLLPSESSLGNHIKADVLNVLDWGWDLMIAHPPCDYLCVSGLHWNGRIPGREDKTEEALEFVMELMNAKIDKIAIENPVGCISTRIRKPDQIIQPYEFGHDASKKTCLWLKNLTSLKPTTYVQPRIVNGKNVGQIKRTPVKTDWVQARIVGNLDQLHTKVLPMQWRNSGVR